MFNKLISLAKEVGEEYQKQHLKIVTAESCTGGQIAYVLTSIAGSSNWFERGFVTYSNEAKQDILKVPSKCLENYGAVSEQTALAMAKGALQASLADVSIVTTGIAGPGGGLVEKPVGTVWFAWCKQNFPPVAMHVCFEGNRLTIRDEATKKALDILRSVARH